jgi:hypothetical protein
MCMMRSAILTAVLVASGCAATGGWPIVSRTTRGVEADVPGTLDNVEQRARTVLEERGLEITRDAPTDDGTGRVVEGQRSSLRVVVEIRDGGSSAARTEVIAFRNFVEWDRTLARELLDRIWKIG